MTDRRPKAADGKRLMYDPGVEIVRNLGLLHESKSYLEKTNYFWAHVIPRWLKTLPSDQYDLFNRSYYDGERIYHGVSVSVPVICVDAPLFLVKISEEGHIENFHEADRLLTGIRVSGWPGRFRHSLARPTPEALVVVVSISALEGLLADIRQWFNWLVQAITETDSHLVRKSLLQAAFYRAAIAEFAPVTTSTGIYRSDLDLGISWRDEQD